MPATMMSTDQPWNVEITAVTYTCISSALICRAWQTHKTTNRPFFFHIGSAPACKTWCVADNGGGNSNPHGAFGHCRASRPR